MDSKPRRNKTGGGSSVICWLETSSYKKLPHLTSFIYFINHAADFSCTHSFYLTIRGWLVQCSYEFDERIRFIST